MTHFSFFFVLVGKRFGDVIITWCNKEKKGVAKRFSNHHHRICCCWSVWKKRINQIRIFFSYFLFLHIKCEIINECVNQKGRIYAYENGNESQNPVIRNENIDGVIHSHYLFVSRCVCVCVLVQGKKKWFAGCLIPLSFVDHQYEFYRSQEVVDFLYFVFSLSLFLTMCLVCVFLSIEPDFIYIFFQIFFLFFN